MELLHLNRESFAKLTTQTEKTVLIDFWATWCGPCQMLTPVLEEIAAEHDELIVGKVNVDDFPDLAAQLMVDSIPALFLFKEGRQVKRLVGYMDKKTLTAKLGL